MTPIEKLTHLVDDLSRRLGEAEGKLVASEAVGVVEGWRDRCARLGRALRAAPSRPDYDSDKSFIDAWRNWEFQYRGAALENKK